MKLIKSFFLFYQKFHYLLSEISILSSEQIKVKTVFSHRVFILIVLLYFDFVPIRILFFNMQSAYFQRGLQYFYEKR